MSDKKTVMITGAGGYFAWTLIHELKEKTEAVFSTLHEVIDFLEA